MAEPTNLDDIHKRSSDLHQDLTTALGRTEEALDVLEAWAADHPNDQYLVRMTRNILGRFGRTLPDPPT